MSYTSVVVIWLWANLILIIATPIIFFLHHNVKEGTFIAPNELFISTIITIFLGFLYTIPSLIVMLVFHFLYSRRTFYLKAYFRTYCFLILSINVIYFVVFKFFYKTEFMLESPIELLSICLITIAAGLVGLSIEHKRLTKNILKY